MAWFQSSETRKRNRFIDDSVCTYADVIANPKARTVMGEVALGTFPFADHDYVIRNLTVPNMRNGALDLPQMTRKNPDAIPIWAGFIGDEVAVRGHYMPHPKQEQRWRTFLKSHGIPDSDIDAKLRSIAGYTPPTTVTVDEESEAAVLSRIALIDILTPSIGKNPRRFFSGQPLAVLNMGEATNEGARERANPATLGHEVTHVIQRLYHPVRRLDTVGDREDLSFRAELEAYFLEAVVIEGLAAIHYQKKPREVEAYTIDSASELPLSGAAVVATITMEVNANRRDKFFPDGKIRQQLAGLEASIHTFNTNNTGRHLPIEVSFSKHAQ